MIVPEHLWERVNAVDSNGYVIATIFGPPLAAGLVAIVGGPLALIGTAVAFGLSARGDGRHPGSADRRRFDRQAAAGCPRRPPICVAKPDDPRPRVLDLLAEPGRRDHDDRSSRSSSSSDSATRRRSSGVIFAISGVAGMVSALIFGRWTRGSRVAAPRLPDACVRAGHSLLLLPPAIDRRTRPGRRAAVPRRLGGRHRDRQRPAGHRPVHDPPAANRSGLDGPGVRGVDGDELHRFPDRGGDRRGPRRSTRSASRSCPAILAVAGGRRIRGDHGSPDRPEPGLERIGEPPTADGRPGGLRSPGHRASVSRPGTGSPPSTARARHARLWLRPSRTSGVASASTDSTVSNSGS